MWFFFVYIDVIFLVDNSLSCETFEYNSLLKKVNDMNDERSIDIHFSARGYRGGLWRLKARVYGETFHKNNSLLKKVNFMKVERYIALHFSARCYRGDLWRLKARVYGDIHLREHFLNRDKSIGRVRYRVLAWRLKVNLLQLLGGCSLNAFKLDSVCCKINSLYYIQSINLEFFWNLMYKNYYFVEKSYLSWSAAVDGDLSYRGIFWRPNSSAVVHQYGKTIDKKEQSCYRIINMHKFIVLFYVIELCVQAWLLTTGLEHLHVSIFFKYGYK